MKTKASFFLPLLLALLVLAGCSPALAVRLSPEYEISMQFESGTGTELTKTFTALTGQQMGYIQTGPAVKSMKAAGLTASGIAQNGSQFTLTTGPDKAAGILPGCPDAISVSGADSGKSAGTSGASTGNAGQLSFNLSPETAQYIISLLPEETASYTELFMAPLFTGEIMSASEYEDLIAVVYGQQLATELSLSRFTLNISVPGPVTSVTVPATLNATCSKSGETARISLPLSSLLTLSDAQSILVFFDKTKYTN